MSGSDRGYLLYPSTGAQPAEIDIEARQAAWQQPTAEPVRRTPFILATLAPALFFLTGAVVPVTMPVPVYVVGAVRQETIVYQQKAEPVPSAVVPLSTPMTPSSEDLVADRTIVYQQKAEPLEPITPDTSADEFTWWIQPNEPVRVDPRPVDEGGMVEEIDHEERIGQDILSRWWHPASEPVRVKPRLVDEGMLARAPPDPFDFLPPIGWLPATNEPGQPDPRAVNEGGPTLGREPPPVFDLDWHPRFPDTPPPVPRLVDVGENQRNLDPISKLDLDWWSQGNEPQRQVPRLVDEGLHVWQLADPESFRSIFPDWLPQPNEPVRVPPPLRTEPDATQVEILPIAVVFTPTAPGNVIRPVRRPVDEGGLVRNLDPIVAGLDELRPAAEPVRTLPRLVDEGIFVRSDLLPPIADRDWFQPTNEPVRIPPRLTDEGLHVWNLDDLPTGLDELRPAAEPVRTKARLVDEGTRVQNLDPISKFDFDWWQQGNEPQRQVPPLRPDPDATQVEILPQQPVPPFDSWWRPTETPPDPVPRLVDEGQHIWNLDDEPTGIVELRPPSEPVRVPPRAVNEGGLIWVGELPPIADFDWWRPATEPVRVVPRPTLEPDATQVEILPEAVDFVPSQLADRFPLPQLVPEGVTVRTSEPPPVADFDWWRLTAEPVRQLGRLVDEGSLVRNLDPIVRGFEQAALRLPEIPVLPPPSPEGLFVQDLTQPLVEVDFGWWRPASEPERDVAPLRPQFFVLGDVPRPTGIVELRPPTEPVRTKPRLVDEGMVAREILPPILPFVEGVLRLPAIPVLPIWTGAHLHVPPVQVEELPFPGLPIFQPLPLLLTLRDCAPIVISSERWPHQFNRFTINALTNRGEVDALDPFPAPSGGGAADPAIDPREPNLQRRHEWNL